MKVKTIDKRLRESTSPEEIKLLLLKGVLTKLEQHIKDTDFLTTNNRDGKIIYYSKPIEKEDKQLVCDQYFTRTLQKIGRELMKELSDEAKQVILRYEVNINKATTLYVLKSYSIVYAPQSL